MSIFDPAAAVRRQRYQFWLEQSQAKPAAGNIPHQTPAAEPERISPASAEAATSQPAALPAFGKFRPLGESVADRAAPMTWVFTGQSLPGSVGGDSEIPLSGLVGVFVRNVLERAADPIIDTTGPDLRIRDLLKQFHQRISRFRPQVVVVGGSLSEADRGIDGLPRFEHHLVRFIHECRRIGSDVVLQTPRYVPGGAGRDDIDGLVYVEAIRSLAAEQGVGLVDHWEQEAAMAASPERPSDPLDREGLLARFVTEVGLLAVVPSR